MWQSLTVTSDEGTGIRAVAKGEGHPIVIVHGGLDDGSSWHRVAQRLARRWRVARLHRRQYRLDLAASLPCTMAQEAEDVAALAASLGEGVVLVGHSSGAVVALEALVAAPSRFAGAVLYEPPIHLRPGEWDVQLAQAKAARGPGKALRVFTRDIVGLPGWMAWLIGVMATVVPRFRRLTPHQIDDAAAINDLGVRLDAYAGIDVPVVLLGGDRSPAHLGERLDALARVLPQAEKVVMPGIGHDGAMRAPDTVAKVVEDLATRAGTPQPGTPGVDSMDE
ncbi:MAG: alpha/beta hydrolase [Hamadaea sp.]|nr:alpha/beta hydrolase [Hamadaea sp.]